MKDEEFDPRCWSGDWGALPSDELDPGDTVADHHLDAKATQPVPPETMARIAKLSVLVR